MENQKIVILTKSNFEQEVLKSDKLFLVDFWAQWCGPCRAVGPVVDELAIDYYEKVKMGKVNVDEEGELAAKYRIMSIPTVMLFKNGEVVERIIGARSKSEFASVLDKNI